MENIRGEIEAKIRADLRAHFLPAYGDRVDGWVDELLTTAHFGVRFAYLESVVGRERALGGSGTALISGFGAGSEMLVAREFGFERVLGVEVDPFLVAICRTRLAQIPGMEPTWYDGSQLPFPDRSVDAVVSGHIIEHTADPALYLRESVRVLVTGGHLSLEFPTRYHLRELHTGLPSLEWLPSPVRNAGLRLLSSPRSPLDPETRSRYESIVTTGLQQISFGEVRRVLSRCEGRFRFVGKETPRPGIVRCVVRRDA